MVYNKIQYFIIRITSCVLCPARDTKIKNPPLTCLFSISDVNVRVSVLTLYGALVMTQAPLPEVQLLLRQPEGSSSAGSFTPQEATLSWRQRDGAPSPSHTPTAHSQHDPLRPPHSPSPCAPRTPSEAEAGPPWLLQLCISLVIQPREDQSDSEGVGMGGAVSLEPAPVRLEALQVGEKMHAYMNA